MEPTTWPCGTPRSPNNAFTAWKDGSPSVLATPREAAAAKNSMRMTREVDRQRATGNDKSAFYGMSSKADRLLQQCSHDGAYSRAGTAGGMAKAKKKARA